MATGLSLPIRARAGRAVLATGEEQLKKIIFLSLCDCSSSNPFQDLGVPLTVIFSNQDDDTRARVERRVRERFAQLESDERARLADGYPQFTEGEDGELLCDIRYVNLETTSEEELNLAFDPDGLGRIVPEAA
jgi:hypothetical protein